MKLLCDAHASSSVPSTRKSLDMSRRGFGVADHGGEELIGDVVVQQTRAVIGERRRVERRLVNAVVWVASTVASTPGLRVGWSLALPDFQPAEGGEDRLEQARARAELDWIEVSRDDDFIGVQTYTRNLIGPHGAVRPEGVPTTQTGWEFIRRPSVTPCGWPPSTPACWCW